MMNEFEVKGIKLRVKEINPFEFSAFKMVYVKSLNDNDIASLSKAYSILCSWIEMEMNGTWVTAWNKVESRFINPLLNTTKLGDEVINKALETRILPLFQNSEE